MDLANLTIASTRTAIAQKEFTASSLVKGFYERSRLKTLRFTLI